MMGGMIGVMPILQIGSYCGFNMRSSQCQVMPPVGHLPNAEVWL
jgi:hypothetical protein